MMSAIGSLTKRASSIDPKKEFPEGDFIYVDIGAVDQDRKQVTQPKSIPSLEAPSRARQLLIQGDILVSTVRPNLNAVAMVGPELDGAVASTGFCVLRPKAGELDGSFLFHWVKSRIFIDDMIQKSTGASYPAVSDRIILESLIPGLGIEEQRRIAAMLDEAEELRAKRRAAIALLDQLPQAVFFEMFGDPATNAKGWDTKPLKEVTTKIGSGSTPTGGESAYKTSGIALIRSMNIHDGQFVPRGLAYIDDTQAAKLSNVVVASKDVLLNITGASVARVAMVPSDVLPARVNQHVSILRCAQGLSPRFLESLLINPSTKKNLLRVAGAGATREAITKEQLESFQIPLPPLEAQRLFAEQVETIYRTKSVHQTALAALDALFSTLQDQSFGGGNAG